MSPPPKKLTTKKDDISVIAQLHSLLNHRQTSQVILLVMGMCAAAVMEMVGIASVPFFVSVLINPAQPTNILPFEISSSLANIIKGPNAIFYGAMGLAIFFLFKNFFLAALSYSEGRVLRNISTYIATRLYSAYLFSSYELHLQRNSAISIRNLTSEAEQVRQLLRTNMQAFKESLVLLAIATLLLIADPIASVTAILLIGLSGMIFFLIVRKKLQYSGLKAQQFKTKQLQWINQGLGSLTLAKMMGKESYLHEGFRKAALGKEEEQFFQKFLASMPRLFLEIAALFTVLIVAGIVTYLKRDPATLFPTLALLSVSVVRLVPSLTAITSAMSQVQAGKAALNAIINDLAIFEAPIISRKLEINKSSNVAKSSSSPLIEFKKTYFSFQNSGTGALSDINFSIEAGESVGIVGQSGSGKSTLIALLLGLLKTTQGDVLIQGVPAETFLHNRKNIFGYIPQHVYLLDEPLRNNIAFGIVEADIDQAAVEHAAQAAQVHDFISSLPEGYNTSAGDHGARLSGGQLQRIGIARALYHNPEILVMDEATSALDTETENSIIDAISNLDGNRTLIIVAHRLNTLRDCKRIIRLENGKLVEDGSHAEILKGEGVVQQ